MAKDLELHRTDAAVSDAKVSLETGNTDFAFKNNVPDPLLSGKELPTLQVRTGKVHGKVDGGSFGKEATVEQLPISKGIAGVSMRLEPGVTRELHWHATAAEWAFVLEGRCRTTVDRSAGPIGNDDFEPGDVWYFPRGHGHSIQCLGDAAVPFHPDLRQRLLFRVRHLQHHRLDGPCAEGAVGQEFWLARGDLRGHSQEAKSISPRGRFRPKSRRRRWRARPRRPRGRTNIGCSPRSRTRCTRRPRVARRSRAISDFADHDGCGARPGARRTARTALASQRPTSGNTWIMVR